MSETMGRCRSEVDSYRKPEFHYAAIADAIDRLAEDVAAVKAAILPQTTEERDAAIRERDAAIRERDEARALLGLAQVQRNAAYADRDEAWAEVYRLKCSMTETSKERDAAIRERDEARAEAQRIQDEADDQEQTDKVKRLNAEIDKIHYTLMNRTCERDEARAEVQRLKAELAARPAANSPEISDSSPADPPPAAPAAGWLTGEERAQLRFTLDRMRRLGYSTVAEAIESIVNRAGSPPVVEVPELRCWGYTAHEEAMAYRAALDKAGVKWKEVGRE